jgi:uncharacterized protein involved in type VI secretion and phage assembly
MTALDSGKQLLGKFRAEVVELEGSGDKLGRIRVKIPDVSGSSNSNWALPCLPISGVDMGFLAIPPVGSDVWVEFEQGDINRPIWTGGFWKSKDDLPSSQALDKPAKNPGENIVIQNAGSGKKATLILSLESPSSTAGGIVLQSGSSKIVINDSGIYLDNGKGATLTLRNNTVSVNDGALEVM